MKALNRRANILGKRRESRRSSYLLHHPGGKNDEPFYGTEIAKGWRLNPYTESMFESSSEAAAQPLTGKRLHIACGLGKGESIEQRGMTGKNLITRARDPWASDRSRGTTANISAVQSEIVSDDEEAKSADDVIPPTYDRDADSDSAASNVSL